MSNAFEQSRELTPEEQSLEYTQNKRKQLVDLLTVGEGMPADRGDKMVLLSALSDMDKVTLTKMKIKSEDKQAVLAGKTAQAIAALLSKVTPRHLQAQPTTDTLFPTLGNDIPEVELVDGETTLGTQSENYESFSKKMFIDSTIV